MPLRIDRPVTLYTIEEAHKVVGVSQPTLWRAVWSGKLPAVKYGHYVLIAEEDLWRWKAECYREDMAQRRRGRKALRRKRRCKPKVGEQ